MGVRCYGGGDSLFDLGWALNWALQCHTQVTHVIHVTCVAGASVSGSESGS